MHTMSPIALRHLDGGGARPPHGLLHTSRRPDAAAGRASLASGGAVGARPVQRRRRGPRLRHALALTLALGLAGSGCGADDGAATPDVSHLELPPNPSPPPSAFVARDHVAGDRFTQLVIEIDYVTGRAPDEGALDELRAALASLVAEGYLAKPDGVSIVIDEVIPAAPEGTVYRFVDLRAIAEAYRNVPVPAGASSIYALYADGSYEADGGGGRVLGFAWGGSWMVMMSDNIAAACEGSSVLQGPLLGALRGRICARVEAMVFLHELGHLFGLVDNGIPMVEDHADPDHPAHTRDPNCLMYWQIPRSSAVDGIAQRFLGGGEPPLGFCPPSLADLAATAGSR